jgi:hypothetical protein
MQDCLGSRKTSSLTVPHRLNLAYMENECQAADLKKKKKERKKEKNEIGIQVHIHEQNKPVTKPTCSMILFI